MRRVCRAGGVDAGSRARPGTVACVRPAVLPAVAALVALLAAPSPAVPAVPGCAPLTPRQRVAQTVGAPLPGPEADAASRALVAEHAGTVVLLGRSIATAEQVRGLIAALRAEAPARLLVAVDEEGGRVARFGRAGLAPHLPSARQQAATRSPEQVRALAAQLAAALRGLGVDWNLAPVLDVTDAAAGSVIGDRSYSPDPGVAGSYAAAFAAGLHDGGLLTAGKHAPGHGRTAVDSHLHRPVVDAAVADLARHDLAAYTAALPHLDALMLAHLLVPALDPERPTSLSPAAVRLVRDTLGFDGALVTDDLSMRAITVDTTQPDAALAAVAAGADLALVGDAVAAAAATDRITAAVAAGDLPRTRVQEAVRRVLALKGYAPAEATCLLGLPPVAAAAAVVDGDGVVHAVRDGIRHRVPDPETVAALGLDPERYDDAEVAGLPAGDPVPTARRFAAEAIAAPGADPAAVALARAALDHPAGAAARVVVARADDHADALAGATLAGPDAPLLLAHPDGRHAAAVAAAAQRALAPGGTIYLLGGQAALGPEAVGALHDHPAAVRLAGPDRYATAAAVAAEAATARGQPPLVLLARGDDWADAIAAAPLAARDGAVVLLTRPDDLPTATAAALPAGVEVVVLGGSDAVTPHVAAQAGAARRVAGETRAGTAAAVARLLWGREQGRPGDRFVVANDWGHVLAATPIAARLDAPALLTSADRLAPEARSYLTGLGYPAGATATLLTAGARPPDLLSAGIP